MGCNCNDKKNFDEDYESECDNYSNSIENDFENNIVTLTLEDGNELKCNILGIFEIDKREYISLLAVGDDEVLIYRYKENGEDINLSLIESDEEFNNVLNVFNDLFSKEESND